MRVRAAKALQAEIVRYSHLLAERAWVANHDGNLSVRSGSDFLVTPTATAKRDVCEANLLEVDQTGARVRGQSRPFSEMALHLAVFKKRSDVEAVVHAHPPYATALACSGANLIERPFLPEAIVSLGPLIPTIALAAPGPAAVDALAPEVERVDAVLLANHGVLTWGSSLELAFLRMELVEHLARIATLAQATGGTRPLPQSMVDKLLESRAKAKLGQAAERALEFRNNPVFACAPAPHSKTQVQGSASTGSTASTASSPSPDLVTIIREEIARATRD